MRRAALLVLFLGASAMAGACEGQTGTIAVTLVSAPGSDLMDRVTRARLLLSHPPTVVEASRDEHGQLVLDLELPAQSRPGTLVFEGFDAGGERIAFGRSGPLPMSAATVDIALYVAPPMSMAAAPEPLDPPRSDMGVAALPYGALLAGGRTSEGASDALAIYSVHTHAFQPRAPLPAPRIAPAAVAGLRGTVYLFGGLGPDGAPQRDALAFQPTVAPEGAYVALRTEDTEGELRPRAGAHMTPLDRELFVATGDPVALVDGLGGRVTAFPEAPALQGTATTTFVGNAARVLFVGAGSGDSGAVLLADGRFIALAAPKGEGEGEDGASPRRTGHAAVLLPDGSILVVGGMIEPSGAQPNDPDGPTLASAALRFHAAERRFERLELLARPRSHAAVAATDAHLVVAGGVDAGGALIGDVEVFDALSLDAVAVLPMVVTRRGAAAVALANGQVLIVGGVGEDGAPVAVAELFTPAP